MAPTRPPEVAARRLTTPTRVYCFSCREPILVTAFGVTHRLPHGTHCMNSMNAAPGRPRCPSCNAEWNMPNMSKVTGCLPTCPLYGRRLPQAPPAPFAPQAVNMDPPKVPKSGAESGRRWLDAQPMLSRVRAWEALERACDAWVQHRDAAASGLTSQLSIQISEGFIEDAVRRLRALRKGER